MPLGMLTCRIKGGEGQCSPTLPPDKVVILPHGIVEAGAGQKALMFLILTLQMNGDVASRSNGLYKINMKSGRGFFAPSLPCCIEFLTLEGL